MPANILRSFTMFHGTEWTYSLFCYRVQRGHREKNFCCGMFMRDVPLISDIWDTAGELGQLNG